jgi:ABC-2 type transport system ATP-binding protein
MSMSESMPPIVVRGLRKEYRSKDSSAAGTVVAVDGLDLEVAAGEVYALLGHNGAGKTTSIEILEGHRTRTSGEVKVLGVDPGEGGRDLRDRIGVVLQTSGVEPELSVAEVLEIARRSYRSPRSTSEVIDVIGLNDKADQRVGSLSGGQARRVALGLGIIGRPELLFLDEPTTGFDPVARRSFWDLISRLAAEGTTVLLTTHYLDEAEHLADRVGVMADGRLIAEGTPADLVRSFGGSTVRFSLPGSEAVAWSEVLQGEIAAQVSGTVTVTASGRVEISSSSPTSDLSVVTAWAVSRRVELPDLEVVRSSLEDVFIRLEQDR